MQAKQPVALTYPLALGSGTAKPSHFRDHMRRIIPQKPIPRKRSGASDPVLHRHGIAYLPVLRNQPGTLGPWGGLCYNGGKRPDKESSLSAKTLPEFQAEIDTWVQSVGGGYWSPHENLARIAEEVGELARLLNHVYGPKPKKASEPLQELGEELADIIFAIACLANSQGIDLGQSLDGVIAKVWRRDRNRYRAEDV
jgi:NTP pyrophosphatase (non-canonical NTP hydrolase)